MCLLDDPGGWVSGDPDDHCAMLERRLRALESRKGYNRANAERAAQMAKEELALLYGCSVDEVAGAFSHEELCVL